MFHNMDLGSKPSIVDDFMYSSNVARADVYIRMGFLRKVYGILSAQFLVTTLIGMLFVTIDPIREFSKSNGWLVLVCGIASIGFLIGLSLKSYHYPINYILLGLFTICESILVGTVVTLYEVASVVQVFALTCAVTVGLTLYAMQSKRDFSTMGAGLYACLWVLILFGFFQIFFPGELLERGIAAGGAVLFSLFIIFDTHMVMNKLSHEEYIFATVSIYLDILNLFLHLLRLFGQRRE